MNLDNLLKEWKEACKTGNGWAWLDQQPIEAREAIRSTEDYQVWYQMEAEKADAHNCRSHLIPYDSEYDVCTECGALIPHHE